MTEVIRYRIGPSIGVYTGPERSDASCFPLIDRLAEGADGPVEQPAQEVVEVVFTSQRILVVDVFGIEVLADVEHRCRAPVAAR